MARYRRKKLTRGENLAATATSLAIGAGVAAAAWYVTRILLSRDDMSPPELADGRTRALPQGTVNDATTEG